MNYLTNDDIIYLVTAASTKLLMEYFNIIMMEYLNKS